MARPIVTTGCKGVDDFAIDSETCLQVPVDDLPAMARAVLRLLTDEQLHRRLVANGLATASRFTWDAAADKMERAMGLAPVPESERIQPGSQAVAERAASP